MKGQITSKTEAQNSSCQEDTPLQYYSYTDLYVLGKLCIDALSLSLVGAKVIPTVEAAKPPEVPTKPPPMRHSELPFYDNPHQIYKDYLEDLDKCPKAKTKMIHEYVQPYVSSWRKSAQANYCDIKCELQGMKKDAYASIAKSTEEFKAYMRSPKNVELRNGVVVAGALTGYLFAAKKGIPSRLFFTSLGALAGGALCFPEETDEIFRTAMYHIGKTGLLFYNFWCKRNYSLRERLTCENDMPTPKEVKKTNPCPK